MTYSNTLSDSTTARSLIRQRRHPYKPKNLGQESDSRSRIKSRRPTILHKQITKAPLNPGLLLGTWTSIGRPYHVTCNTLLDRLARSHSTLV